MAPNRPVTAADPQWNVDLLDPVAYLGRIGHPAPGPDALASVHRAHKAAIPFENVDVALERGVSLDLADVQAKLVHARRGGYCFEHNLLFAAALEHFGFTVTRLLGRVRLNRPVVRYRAHTVLLVEAEGTRFLCDVGFGAQGLLVPIPFEDGAIVTAGGFRWRLVREAGQWVLQIRQDGAWFELYSFALEQHHAVDFEVSNYYTSHHPRSTFTGRLVVMRGDEQVQQTLTGTELSTRHADGRTDHSTFAPADVPAVLREVFDLSLSSSDSTRLVRFLDPYQEA
ncbi:arylamine N-acetyltransferase family protein [Lentzea sp. NPDC055074]